MNPTAPRPARRLPLWTTLVPLLLGAGLWFFLWSGFRDSLEEALSAVLPRGVPLAIGGFPYRLEARTGPVTLEWRGAAASARLNARELTVNRQPWRTDRQVVNLADSEVALALAPLAGMAATLRAPAAQASLRTDDGRVARLSIVWERPAIRLAFLDQPIAAESFEAHLRETPLEAKGTGSAAGNAGSPLFPVQDQLVLRGNGLRIGEGSPLSLAVEAELTAAHPVRSFLAWRDGGTAEIRDLVLADATGEVLRMVATLSPGADGRLLVAGTITTVCPASVRAALAGLPPVTEKRTRRAVTLAFTAVPGVTAEIAPPDPATPAPPVRGQEPDCPRLR